jgi:hypothetical protein
VTKNENEMRKADSLTLPRPKGKHSHATSEQGDQIVRKSESSPLSLSSGRSRSAERIGRAGKTSKEMKRRSVPSSAHPEKTEGDNHVTVLTTPEPTEHKAEVDQDVLNNLQHAAQFTITILPHGKDFEKPPHEKKVRAGQPTPANHSNESPP